jgi:Ala-tRNA(Pro) deacylase
MRYHPITRRIQDILVQNQCWFESFEHRPVRTSEEAAAVRPGYSLDQGAKAIILRVKQADSDTRFVMLVLPANLRFDNSKVKAFLGASDIRFATKDEISSLTDGVELGGVPPFGNLFELDVIADPTLFENERIVFNAGDKRFSIAMRSFDYRHLVRPIVAPIVE